MLNRFGFLVIFFATATFLHAQTVKVSPQSQNINPGQSVTVKIETTKIDKCTITGKPYNNFNIIKNGNVLLRPTETTEYAFNCQDTSGKVVSAKTRVTIVPINSGNAGNSGPSIAPRDRGPSIQIPNSGGSANSQYSSQTLTSAANSLCGKYSAYSSVYPPATAGTGGGSVPVDLTNLASILLSIDRNTQLTANEFRQDNLFRYCTEYQNMARATARLAETSAKTIKNIADACYADERCMVERVYKAAYEQEVNNLCKDEENGEVLCKLIQDMNAPKTNSNEAEEKEMKKYCNKMFSEGFYPRECVLVEKTFEDVTEKYYEARERISIATNDIRNQFKSGVMGARPCVETASGRPPEEVRFYEPDCIRYRQEPSIINEEALRQITALPYTQAFSPSSVLGFDGVLDNINTRTREGNLVVPNISPNFGSVGGGTNGGGGGNPGTDLKSVEENYKKIARNIGTILQWYDAGKLAYASSTYVCRYLPIATRRAAIEKIEQNKKPYVDYLINLKKMWDQAVAKPREDHSALILKINFDLKDKYNQQEIEKVSESIQKILKACTDARAAS